MRARSSAAPACASSLLVRAAPLEPRPRCPASGRARARGRGGWGGGGGWGNSSSEVVSRERSGAAAHAGRAAVNMERPEREGAAGGAHEGAAGGAPPGARGEDARPTSPFRALRIVLHEEDAKRMARTRELEHEVHFCARVVSQYPREAAETDGVFRLVVLALAERVAEAQVRRAHGEGEGPHVQGLRPLRGERRVG